jgi:beta-galactosidase/beta-glucuronidase
VKRHKDSPALRMWGLGNEVLHGMVDPKTRRSQTFAAFLVQAADLIHGLDPSHPVVYRDAEDAYLLPLANALRATSQPRPWFVYGMNFFSTRMDDALTKGPTRTLPQALLISEYGPVGLRPADRPVGYMRFWNVLRSRPKILGGFAYVWTTAGPEPLDRGFGLTNPAGEPVDGTLAAMASVFVNEQLDEKLPPDLSAFPMP